MTPTTTTAHNSKTPAVTQAIGRAAKAAADFDKGATPEQTTMPVSTTRQRRNFYFVFVKFTDGTAELSHGLRGTGEINDWLRTKDSTLIASTTVLLGHERKAKTQTRLVFT